MTYLDDQTIKAINRSTITTELWVLYSLGLLLAVLFSTWAYTGEENPCDPSNEGTDYWYEVCLGDGPIDLGIQDEADTTTSMGRVEL